MRNVEIRRAEDGRLVCTAGLANNPLSRMKGLLGKKELPEGQGLLIEPCNSVHMVFMRFALDVVYIDKQDTVVKAVENLKPNRFSAGGRKAHAALELPTGTIAAAEIAAGDRLTIAR